MQDSDLDLVLGGVPDAARRARRWVASHLVGSEWADLAEDAALAVSELVTNAALHGVPPVHLRLRTTGDGVRLEVADGSPLGPEPLLPGPEDPVGRGVAVVEALSSAWGWQPTDTGKVVWCDLRGDAGAVRRVPTPPIPPPRNRGGTEPTVEVPDVPVGLLLRMVLHSEAQSRELSLFRPPVRSAPGGDGVIDLCERARRVTTRSRLHRRLRAQAMAADRAGRDRVDLVVETRLLMTEGQEYLGVLDALDAWCRTERLLTLESPAVLRCLRRWLAGELSSGPARSDGIPTEPPQRFETVLAEEVTRLAADRTDIVRVLEASPDAVVAIDVAGVIRVVNRHTEDLFGYERRDLLGRPLEILVPDALRRAHRMHLADFAARPRTRPMGAGLELSGRRRDGSEFPADISLAVLDTEMGRLVTASVRDLTGLRAMRESLRESHRIAEILQRSLLDAVPRQVAGVRVATRYRPAGSAATVGGDWHDVFPLADGLIGVTVGDVTGHGVDAASVMGRIRTWISARAWDQPSPAAVLRSVNQMLCRMSDPALQPSNTVDRPEQVDRSEPGVLLATALFGRLDPVRRTFDYAVAGHPGPISVDSGSATARLEHPAPNLPLGLDPDLEYVDQNLDLPARGMLVAFTDGLFEQRGINIEESLETVVKHAAQLADQGVDDLADSLVAAAPPPALPWSDDLALVVVRY